MSRELSYCFVIRAECMDEKKRRGGNADISGVRFLRMYKRRSLNRVEQSETRWHEAILQADRTEAEVRWQLRESRSLKRGGTTDNRKLLVAMRLRDTPVPIPNTTVKP